MNVAEKIQKDLQDRCHYLWGRAKAASKGAQTQYWEALAYEADIAFATAQKHINIAAQESRS